MTPPSSAIETEARAGEAEGGVLDVERLARIYREHPEPSESTEWVAHERGRCQMVCWRWIAAEYAALASPEPDEEA